MPPIFNDKLDLIPVDYLQAVKESEEYQRTFIGRNPVYLAVLSCPHFCWATIQYSNVQKGPTHTFMITETNKKVCGLDVKQLFRLPRPLKDS